MTNYDYFHIDLTRITTLQWFSFNIDSLT